MNRREQGATLCVGWWLQGWTSSSWGFWLGSTSRLQKLPSHGISATTVVQFVSRAVWLAGLIRQETQASSADRSHGFQVCHCHNHTQSQHQRFLSVSAHEKKTESCLKIYTCGKAKSSPLPVMFVTSRIQRNRRLPTLRRGIPPSGERSVNTTMSSGRHD